MAKPTAFGRYEILGELGSGGMASVYLGRTSGLGGFERLLAIKVLHEHLCHDTNFVKMFLDEARSAARIYHPSVISVHDVGEEAGRYYLAMDYVRGETLATVINRAWKKGAGGFPLPLAAHLFSMVLDGLETAHELRDSEGALLHLIHRDLSLRNLMLGYDGLLRILDFGVAKARDHLSRTQPGTQKGTVAYMAPEQVLGRELDRRVDVFAMGVVMWETTVGKRLFQAQNDLATAAKIRQTLVPPPSSMRDDYPGMLEDVVLKSLRREAGDRYQSAHEVAEDLRRYLASEQGMVSAGDAKKLMLELCGDRLEKRRQMEKHAIQLVETDTITQHDAEGIGLHVSAGLPEQTVSENERATVHAQPDYDELRKTMFTTRRAELPLGLEEETLRESSMSDPVVLAPGFEPTVEPTTQHVSLSSPDRPVPDFETRREKPPSTRVIREPTASSGLAQLRESDLIELSAGSVVVDDGEEETHDGGEDATESESAAHAQLILELERKTPAPRPKSIARAPSTPVPPAPSVSSMTREPSQRAPSHGGWEGPTGWAEPTGYTEIEARARPKGELPEQLQPLPELASPDVTQESGMQGPDSSEVTLPPESQLRAARVSVADLIANLVERDSEATGPPEPRQKAISTAVVYRLPKGLTDAGQLAPTPSVFPRPMSEVPSYLTPDGWGGATMPLEAIKRRRRFTVLLAVMVFVAVVLAGLALERGKFLSHPHSNGAAQHKPEVPAPSVVQVRTSTLVHPAQSKSSTGP